MMKLPRLTQCCCCPLKTGVLVIGILTIVLNSLSLMSSLKELYALPDVERIIDENLDESCDEDCKNFVHNYVLFFVISGFISNLISLIIASLMVYGVNNNKPKFLTPYLVECAFTAAVLLIGLLVGLVYFISVPVVVFILFMIVGTSFSVVAYFAIVVRSHQIEMTEAANMNRIPLGEEETAGGFRRFA